MAIGRLQFCWFLIFIIYQYLCVSFLWVNMPDALFFSPPRHFWNCTVSSHVVVSLECVQLDQFKVSMKTVLLRSLLTVMPGQGSRQLHLMLNSELRYIMLWQTSQLVKPLYNWMLLQGALHGSSSRKCYKIEISFFKYYAEHMHCHAFLPSNKSDFLVVVL